MLGIGRKLEPGVAPSFLFPAGPIFNLVVSPVTLLQDLLWKSQGGLARVQVYRLEKGNRKTSAGAGFGDQHPVDRGSADSARNRLERLSHVDHKRARDVFHSDPLALEVLHLQRCVVCRLENVREKVQVPVWPAALSSGRRVFENMRLGTAELFCVWVCHNLHFALLVGLEKPVERRGVEPKRLGHKAAELRRKQRHLGDVVGHHGPEVGHESLVGPQVGALDLAVDGPVLGRRKLRGQVDLLAPVRLQACHLVGQAGIAQEVRRVDHFTLVLGALWKSEKRLGLLPDRLQVLCRRQVEVSQEKKADIDKRMAELSKKLVFCRWVLRKRKIELGNLLEGHE